MKKRYFLLSLLLISTAVNAQIALLSDHFVTESYSGRMSNASTDSELDLNGGSHHLWDFTNLQAIDQKWEVYGDMNDMGALVKFQFGQFAPTKYKATYYLQNDDLPLQNLPSFLPIQISEMDNIVRNSEDSLSNVGIVVTINGQQLPIRFENIETYYYFPLKYGDAYTTYGSFNEDLNPIYDAKWRQKRTHKVEVDGFGTIKAPFGTYDCLRIKHTIKEQDSLYVTVNNFGMWLPVNVPQQTIYEWRCINIKLPLVRIKTSKIGNTETVTSVQFLYNHDFLSTNELTENQFSIYPNPTNNTLNINSDIPFTHFSIFSVDGKEVLNGKQQSSIDCSALKAGTYLIRFSTEKGMVTKPFVKE